MNEQQEAVVVVVEEEDYNDDSYMEPLPLLSAPTSSKRLLYKKYYDFDEDIDEDNDDKEIKKENSLEGNESDDSISIEATRSYAIQALALTVQEWSTIGQSSDPSISESSIFGINNTSKDGANNNIKSNNNNDSVGTGSSFIDDSNSDDTYQDILKMCVHRVTSILIVRIVAIVLHRQHQQLKQQQQQSHNNNNNNNTNLHDDEDDIDQSNRSHQQQQHQQQHDTEVDISTSGICRQALIADEVPWPFITKSIVQQIELYVTYILQNYSYTLPFHNIQHAVTVVTNCNKLIDMILNNENDTIYNSNNNNNNDHDENNQYVDDGDYNDNNNIINDYDEYRYNHHHGRVRRPITFGIRNDPLLVFALVFAALVHDVQHIGKLNSQLIQIQHPISLLYNDQSVQEKQSLYIAFHELLKSKYTILRNIIFNTNNSNNSNSNSTNIETDMNNNDSYRYFRGTVIAAVLSTDLSSPEQMAVTRSKWKEAFYQRQQQLLIQKQQRQQQQQLEQQQELQQLGQSANFNYVTNYISNSRPTNRRLSAMSNLSSNTHNRRGSNYSEISEITTDDIGPYTHTTSSEYITTQAPTSNRRNSVTSEYSNYRRRGRRRSSIQSDVSSDAESSEVAADSVALMYRRNNNNNNMNNNYNGCRTTMKDEVSVDSIVSDTIDSYVLRTTKVVKVQNNVKFGSSGVTADTSDDKDLTNQTPNGNDFPSMETNDNNNNTEVASPKTINTNVNNETDGSTSFVSFPTGSIAVIQKRLEGGPKTRRRANTISNNDVIVTTMDIHDADNNDSIHIDDDNGILPSHEPNLQDNLKTKPAIHDRHNNKRIIKDDIDDDRSGSLTPPSSNDDDDDEIEDDEYEKQRRLLYTPSPAKKSSLKQKIVTNNTNNIVKNNEPIRHVARRASTGAMISRFASLTDQRIDENHSNHGIGNNNNIIEDNDISRHHEYDDLNYNKNTGNMKASKSTNFNLPEIPKYRKRLGIRRSMDLSGEAIEFYSKRSSIGNISTFSGNSHHEGSENEMDDNYNNTNDEADYIKASAIIEALLRMADVGHFYQNWYNMTNWSSRMFHERILSESNSTKQNDIYMNWFDNQILVIDSYLLPLAVQLDESGVFGEFNGSIFTQNIEEIRRHWMIYGYEWCQKLMTNKTILEHMQNGHDK